VPRAKIVPCFPSGTLKSDEQQSTVAERPLLPLAGSQNQALQTRTTGSWSWLRFAVPSRIAHPGGGCRRYDCEDVAPQFPCPMPASYLHGPCGLNFHFQCNEIGGSLPYNGRFRATCTATGSRFTRNLLTIPRPPAPGQADWSEIHVKRALSSPPTPPVPRVRHCLIASNMITSNLLSAPC
jgi:hypothetical protein